jgi:hypothetical protein
MSPRPCAELDRDIQIVQGNINAAKKSLDRTDLDEEQKKTLKFQIEGWKEQLEQLRQERANCS